MSYHNGSVWPHDTAAAALGLHRYGLHAQARQVARALFDAARAAPDARRLSPTGLGRGGGAGAGAPAARGRVSGREPAGLKGVLGAAASPWTLPPP